MKYLRLILLICFGLFFLVNVNAKIKLPGIFTNNMVLQQQSEVPIWGDASPKKIVKITTSWNNKVYKTVSDAYGKWTAIINTPIFGGPFSIEINDETKLKLNNVMIGEVWVCSGQSNMEMPLAGWGKILNYETEIATANYPNIRLLQIEKKSSSKPLNDMKVSMGGWVPCSPQTVQYFSALAYFFGKNLFENKDIPIGLINSSWGGTLAEAWTSGNSLKTIPEFSAQVMNMEKANSDDVDLQATFEKKLSAWHLQIDKLDTGFSKDKPIWAGKNLDDTDWKQMSIPDLWENQGLQAFDGVVWFRKTINIPSDWQNNKLTLSLDMIDDDDITFFNGVEVGQTNGYNLTRTYSIPAKLVKEGKAVITVRVFDAKGGGGIYGDSAQIKLSLSNQKVISMAGKWLYKKSINLTEVPVAPKNWNEENKPTVLFNSMINPLIPFTIKGVIWYQGESNADRAYQYRDLFPLMIKDWRQKWKVNFPFYFVQLANFTAELENPAQSEWAELREAQLQTLHLENTGMAVTIDIGEAKDIHPKNKQEVGRRLSLIARANAYGESVSCSGPIYDSYKIEGSTIRIKFKNTEGGLKFGGGLTLKGFTIAGLDHIFHWADAKIVGDEVIISCKDLVNPIAVRYAWAQNPICNLYNGANLPASPFRTDDWQGITFGNK